MAGWLVRFLGAASAMLALNSPLFADSRMALVIGNSAYRSVPPLVRPAHDAKLLSDLLTTAHFQVFWGVDVGQANMRRAIRDFSAAAAASGPDTVALVYYAGYGVQSDGENYLIPIDANIERETDLPLEAVRLGEVVNALTASPGKTRIVIVDASRGNPFAQFNSSSGRGLAIAEVPAQSMIAYSSAPGAEVIDTAGTASPFMAALVAAAKTPDLSVEEALKLVRVAVHEASEGRQVPWQSSRLTTGFALFSTSPASALGPGAKTAQEWRKELQPLTPAQAFEAVLTEDATQGYEEYLRLFPQPPFAPHVRSLLDRRREMMAWQHAVILNNAASYEGFLARHAGSDLAPTARRLLDRAKARVAAVGPQPATSEPPPKAKPAQAAAAAKQTAAKKQTVTARPKPNAQRLATTPQTAVVQQPAPRSPFTINVGGLGVGFGRR